MTFIAYPAIDVRQGRVVRLRQGDYAQETRYAPDPLALAERYAADGADWLHLVDLDAAREGGYTLLPLLRKITARTRLQVQTGGGVRGSDDVQCLLDAGASRVVVGSIAVREPSRVAGWLGRLGASAIAVALDTRRGEDKLWRLPAAGWTAPTDQTLSALATRFRDAGLEHALCTDIDRDGMLAGPNLALYRELVAAFPDVRWQASGGIRDIGDVDAVRGLGCAGVVLGRALLEGRLALPVEPC